MANIQRIQRILDKTSWTGRELGIVEITNMVSLFKQKRDGVDNPIPLVDPVEFRKMINSITEKTQARTYNGYIAIHEWLSLYHNISMTHEQQAQLRYKSLYAIISSAIMGEDVYSYMESLPAIMTQKQYDDAVKQNREIPNRVAILTPSNTLEYGKDIDENGYYIPPQIGSSISEYSLESFFIESEYYTFNTQEVKTGREGLLDSYYFIMSYNTAIDLIARYYSIPDIVIFKREFYNMPDSTASNLILETLSAGHDVGDMPARKKRVNHNTTLEVLEDGYRRQVSLNNSKAQITIELSDINKLTKSNKTAKKIFVLALIKANEQAIFKGQLARDYVSFPLQELINIGFYSAPQSARKGFYSGMDVLTSIKIKGHIQHSNKVEHSIDILEVLFTGARIEKGQCIIYLNPRINWGFMTQYFTILPKYYFKLTSRASDLVYYIFYLARQHTRDIAEKGYFTISFRAIQQRLQLPSEVDNDNPYRTIKQPIEEAIEELESEHSRVYGSTDFSLLPVYNESGTITDYLDSGYLKISLTGIFAETFTKISQDTNTQIETYQKRQDKIIDQATAINLAKKVKDEDKNK